MDYTIIISHFKRKTNLINCLKGIQGQLPSPKEVIIVNMGEVLEMEYSPSVNFRFIQYNANWKFLPVAAARNLGASLAKTKYLVFLDVDCIPASGFCNTMLQVLSRTNALVMGTPRYMLCQVEDEFNGRSLASSSVLHPSRPVVNGYRFEKRYELLWSLCFAIPQESYDLIGGFDENYSGYGCEDTDFALKAKEMNIPFYLSSAEVFHQQHPIYVPPLNNIESIVLNCNRFKSKWGYWPMSGCLLDFHNLGLIQWHKEQDCPITILQLPSKKLLEDHLLKNAPYR